MDRRIYLFSNSKRSLLTLFCYRPFEPPFGARHNPRPARTQLGNLDQHHRLPPSTEPPITSALIGKQLIPSLSPWPISRPRWPPAPIQTANSYDSVMCPAQRLPELLCLTSRTSRSFTARRRYPDHSTNIHAKLHPLLTLLANTGAVLPPDPR